jgi:hypothetical protein
MCGAGPLSIYPELLLVGNPAELHTSNSIGFAMLPLVETTIPSGTTASASEGRLYAKIVDNPAQGPQVKNIAGMSGGPIFGGRMMEEGFQYWLVGVQSSWYPSIRTVSFCAALPFVDAIHQAANKLLNPL